MITTSSAMTSNPELLSVEGRLKTFKKFATIKGAPLCNPEGFAKAGFFDVSSKKHPDLVKCFSCAKELGNWEPGDDPWKEHVSRGEMCPYVKLREDFDVTLDRTLAFFLAMQKKKIQNQANLAKSEIRQEFESILEKIIDE